MFRSQQRIDEALEALSKQWVLEEMRGMDLDPMLQKRHQALSSGVALALVIQINDFSQKVKRAHEQGMRRQKRFLVHGDIEPIRQPSRGRHHQQMHQCAHCACPNEHGIAIGCFFVLRWDLRSWKNGVVVECALWKERARCPFSTRRGGGGGFLGCLGGGGRGRGWRRRSGSTRHRGDFSHHGSAMHDGGSCLFSAVAQSLFGLFGRVHRFSLEINLRFQLVFLVVVGSICGESSSSATHLWFATTRFDGFVAASRNNGTIIPAVLPDVHGGVGTSSGTELKRTDSAAAAAAAARGGA